MWQFCLNSGVQEIWW